MSTRRLGREFAPAQRQQIADVSGGHTPATLAGALQQLITTAWAPFEKPALRQTVEDGVKLPSHGIIATEIVEDLRAALAQFEEIEADLKE